MVYDGIRSTPEQLVTAAVEEGAYNRLSILSGSHIHFRGSIMELLKKNRLNNIPVVVGGIIPPTDEKKLISKGVKAVFTPKDFKIEQIMSRIVDIIEDSYE